jgi:hypothetical protein
VAATALKDNTNIVAKEFFQVSLVTYLLLTLAETVHEGFVSNFFNMNYLLMVVLITGVAMVLTEPPEGAVRQVLEQTGRAVAKTAASVAAAPLSPRKWVAPGVVDLRHFRAKTMTVEDKRRVALRQMEVAKKYRQLG